MKNSDQIEYLSREITGSGQEFPLGVIHLDTGLTQQCEAFFT